MTRADGGIGVTSFAEAQAQRHIRPLLSHTVITQVCGMEMANENDHIVVSPTVLKVVEQFVAAMRADSAIADEATDRLDNALRKGTVPTPNEISAILFEPPPEDQK